MKGLAAVFVLMLFVTPAAAKVVGVEGMTYPIKERDLLEVIEEKARSMDMDALEEKLQSEIQSQAETFKGQDAVTQLPRATKSKTYRVDLSYTVPHDITDEAGNIIYPAGYRINPLKVMGDHGINYPFLLLVVNGEREAELAWFEQSGFDTPNVKLLVTDGYPFQLAERLKRPVFQFTEVMRRRFAVSETPSLIVWPKGAEYLTVRTIVINEPESQEEHYEKAR